MMKDVSSIIRGTQLVTSHKNMKAQIVKDEVLTIID